MRPEWEKNFRMSTDGQRLRAISAEDLAALQRPVLEAQTLPPDCYHSEAAYRAEVEHIFFKEWNCVGRVEDIPNVGDYLTKDVITEPIIVVRDEDGEIRAHLNVCRHRGCKIVEDAGTAPMFKCPYHGWLYNLNGDLRAAPEFKETVGFDKKSFGLKPVRCEIWEGFIMVNLDPNATPFIERVRDVDQFCFDAYEVGTHITTHRWRFVLKCNWKSYVENYIESYHVPWVHAATLGGSAASLKKVVNHPDITPNQWDLILTPSPSMTLNPSGTPAFRIASKDKDIPAKYRGLPVWAAYPGLAVIPMLDSTLWHSILPLGPDTMEIVVGVAFPPETGKAYLSGDLTVREICDSYARNQEVIMAEDNNICERQQRGLKSQRAAPGRFCKHEILAWKFDNWVAKTAYAEKPGGVPKDREAAR